MDIFSVAFKNFHCSVIYTRPVFPSEKMTKNASQCNCISLDLRLTHTTLGKLKNMLLFDFHSTPANSVLNHCQQQRCCRVNQPREIVFSQTVNCTQIPIFHKKPMKCIVQSSAINTYISEQLGKHTKYNQYSRLKKRERVRCYSDCVSQQAF